MSNPVKLKLLRKLFIFQVKIKTYGMLKSMYYGQEGSSWMKINYFSVLYLSKVNDFYIVS